MALEMAKQDRSVSELLTDLSRETRQLISQEVALAKAEVSDKLSHYTRYSAFLAAAGALAYAGLLTVIAAVVLAAAEFLDLNYWAATLGVGVIVLIVAFVLYRSGASGLKREDPVPRQTIDSMKENVEWMRTHAR